MADKNDAWKLSSLEDFEMEAIAGGNEDGSNQRSCPRCGAPMTHGSVINPISHTRSTGWRCSECGYFISD